jgi:hypothetical protein
MTPISFYISNDASCAGAAAGGGGAHDPTAGVGVARIRGLGAAEAGLSALMTWTTREGHDKYGDPIVLGSIDILEAHLRNMDGAAKRFQEGLYDRLRSNAAFKDTAYLFEKKYPSQWDLWKKLGLDSAAVLTGAMAINCVKNSFPTDSMAEKFTTGVAYAVSSITEANLFFSFMQTVQDVYTITRKGRLPLVEYIDWEAKKVSYFLAFREYRNIYIRKNAAGVHVDEVGREVAENAEVRNLIIEYTSRVLGALAQYKAGSGKSFLMTIRENIS